MTWGMTKRMSLSVDGTRNMYAASKVGARQMAYNSNGTLRRDAASGIGGRNNTRFAGGNDGRLQEIEVHY
jgi:hypothetical protein